MKSYSQNFEDIMLQRVFQNKKNGFYIDIGAYDPDVLSITKVFYDDFEWSGINIEPVSDNFIKFLKKRPRDINIQTAISDILTICPFYIVEGITPGKLDGTALSTFDKNIAESVCKQYGLHYKVIDIQTETLATICQKYVPKDRQIDFLKIDTEGYEKNIISSGDLIHYRPIIILLETKKPNINPLDFLDRDDWNYNYILDPLMQQYQYSRVYFDGLNAFYLANERQDLQKFFTLPPGTHDGISLPYLYKRIYQLNSYIKELQMKINSN